MVVAIWSLSLTLKIPRFHDDLTLKGSLSRFHHHNLTSKVFAMTSWAKGFFDAALALTAALVMTALFRLAAKRDTWLVTGIFAGSSLANRDAQLALNGSKASMGESSSTPLAKLANPFPTLLFDWWERWNGDREIKGNEVESNGGGEGKFFQSIADCGSVLDANWSRALACKHWNR